jgi:hypothetical protein
MKLFAETQAQFQTRLSQEEVLKRLTEYAQPQKSPPGPLQNYKVTVDGQKVVLERKVEARAFFLIKIDCKVEPQVTGTLVKAKIGLRWFGKLIMGSITLLTIPIWIATLAKLVSLSSIDTIFSQDFLIVSAMFLMHYGMMMWQFNSYVKDFKEAFCQVLSAQVVEQNS